MRKNHLYCFLLAGMLVAACTPRAAQNPSAGLDRRVDSVLSLMNLGEKIGQLNLLTSDWDVTGPVMRDTYLEDIRTGRCGNIFNAHTVAYNRKLQKIAIEETRLGIPLLFGYDVIHGHRTIFPIPIAEACSWDLNLITQSARLAAREAAASGLNWTFAPMVDISRDPRWGRVSEGAGEDTWLGARIAAARVSGFQQSRPDDPYSLAACVKHFAAYGAPVAGRDYNTVDMSELAFRQDYLPTYHAGVEAGALTVMASFNDLFGVPATASSFLMTDVLRGEWGFEGFVVSDYTGIMELMNHRVAESPAQATQLALRAGVDMDMQSAFYMDEIEGALEAGILQMDDIDRAVRRVLRVKFQLGLFDDPYLYLDEERENAEVHSLVHMEHALQSALESMVLLKNEDLDGKALLPLENPGRIALIGPLADNQLDLLGSWHAAGDVDRVVTLKEGLERKFPESSLSCVRGCDINGNDRSGFREALMLARNADVVVLAVGESQAQSGEAASRSQLRLPGVQEELALKLMETGTPVILVLLAERPLVFPELNEKARSIIYAWHPGTRGGDALARILDGSYNPSAKLVMTIPRNEGQIPLYYNAKSTGRPMDPDSRFTSKYIDVDNSPLYPFGYGLSYSTYNYGEPRLNAENLGMNDTLEISIEISNSAGPAGEEVVQLYIQDVAASLTRPVKELRGFQKVALAPGETKQLTFSLNASDLAFLNGDLEWVCEAGEFIVMIGPDSQRVVQTKFKLEK